MSGLEQVLYLVVVPAAVVAVIWALAAIGGPPSRKRYRPGRRFDAAPVWYVANHHDNGLGGPGGAGGSGGGQERPALTAAAPGTGTGGTGGGASDRW